MLYKIVSFFTAMLMTVCSFFGIDYQQKGYELNVNKLQKAVTRSQERRLDAGTLTGAHIIINQNGECVLNMVYGKASADGEALKENAVYRIASMTKPVTAVALLIEQERGHLNINDDLADYMPEYADMQVKKADGTTEKAKNPIKLYMLVSHVSGLDDTAIMGEELGVPMEERNARTVAEAAAKLPLVYEPGTAQAYNTAAFDVAARVIEITSGMDFAEYLKVNIFDKLGMTDTTFEPTTAQWDRMVAVHGCENGNAYDVPYDGQIFGAYPVTYHAAGAALTSTAADYDKFARMLLNGGVGDNGERVMSEESVRLMATPVVGDDIMSGSQKWGLGVRVITDNGYTLPKGTFGWSGMFGTHFWIDPVNKITAVYMKNSAFDGGAGCQTANELEKDVMDSFTVKRLK